MLTDRDACMAAWSRGRALTDIRVGEVMARRVYSCWSDDSIEAALELMRERRLRRLPVVDASERLVGILSVSDLALACARGGARELRPAAVGNLMAAISTPHGEAIDKQVVLQPRPSERIEAAHAITSIA
jgi:CBS-domain-containing membrane protein